MIAAIYQSKSRFKGSYISHLLVLFSYYFSMGIFGSILSVYLGGIGKSAGEISLIISGSHIFAFGMIPLVSYLHDKARNPHNVTVIVLALAAVTGLAFAFFRQTWLLFLLNGLSMSLVQCIAPICEQLCSSGKYRYGAVRVWGAVGYALAAQTAGIIYQYVAPVFLFVLFVIAIGVTLIGYWGAKQEANVHKQERDAEQKAQQKDGMFWWNKNFICFLLASFIFAGITGLNSAYLPVYLMELGQSMSQAGTVLFLSTLMEIPLILLSSRFMDRFKDKTLLTAAFVILILQFAIFGLSSSYVPVMAASILLKSVATMLFIMITMKVVVNVVDERFTVSALGLTATVKSLGSVVFQNLGGNFIEHSGIATLYLVLVGFSILGLALSLMVRVKKSKVIFQ